MKIEFSKSNLSWENLEYGDIFIDNNDGYTYMKVGYTYDGKDNLKEYVLDLSSGELFDDYENYDIVKVVKCKLVKDED